MVEGDAVQLLRGRFGCLVTVDACGSFEEKRRVYQYGSQRQAAVPQKRKAPGFSKLWISESRLTARGGTGWDHRLAFLGRQCWVELALNPETRFRCACLQCAVGNGDGKDCNTKAGLRTTQNPWG